MDSYDSIVGKLHRGAVVKFQEYTLNRREQKRLVLEIRDAVVQEVIQPNQALPREVLEQYYGEGLDDVTYLQLSTMNCLRIVIIMGHDDNAQPMYKVLMFNKDFYNAGLQVMEVVAEVATDEPNYVNQMSAWKF